MHVKSDEKRRTPNDPFHGCFTLEQRYAYDNSETEFQERTDNAHSKLLMDDQRRVQKDPIQ